LTITLVVSALTEWVESPRYPAITSRVPADFGVKVTVQLAVLPMATSATAMPDKVQTRRVGLLDCMAKRAVACPVGVVGEEPTSVTVIVHVTASLTVPGLGLQETEVLVLSFPPLAVASAKVPELPWLPLSPTYEAVIVAPPPAEGVYVTAHAPSERLQSLEEKSPVPELNQVTVPVGELPVTVAVQVLGAPTATGEGAQLTVVVVAERPVTVRESSPVLPRLLESPE
jgi:hypothetical protein